MLSDKARFDIIEKLAEEKDILSKFREKHGDYTGRVMVVEREVPESIRNSVSADDELHAFECSFDFLDSTLHVVAAVRPLRIVSDMWAVRQKPDAELPSEDWQKFFINVLHNHIAEDGTISAPMYSFVNDYGDMTIVQS